MTDLSAEYKALADYRPTNKVPTTVPCRAAPRRAAPCRAVPRFDEPACCACTTG